MKGGLEAPNIDLVVYRGRDFEAEFEFEDRYRKVIPLPGITGKAQIRYDDKENGTLLAEFVVQLITLEGNTEPTRVRLTLTDLVTAVMSCGERYYDLLLTTDDGLDYTYMEGQVLVKPSITVK